MSQSLLSQNTDSLLAAGIRLSIEQSYDEALLLANRLEQEQVDNPVGYFLRAAILQTRMMDYESYTQEKEFLELLRKTIGLAKRKLRQDSDDAWTHFFLGASYGYLSFYRAKQNKYWEAFQTAKRSVAALEAAVAKDSTLYDAYLGLGTYKYYLSRLNRHFTWLPFVEDSREEGIRLIKLAMTRSRFSRYSAMNGICWIFIDEQRYQEGLNTINDVLAEFPDSRIFLWCAAKLNKKLKRWNEAAFYYERILASLHSGGVLSPVNELTCRKNLSQIYMKLEKRQKAQEQCRFVSRITLSGEQKKRCAVVLEQLAETCSDSHASNHTAE